MTCGCGESSSRSSNHYELTRCFNDVEIPLVDVLAEMEWTGIAIDLPWFASLKERFQARARSGGEGDL